GIGDVNMDCVTMEVHCYGMSPIGADEQTLFHHLLIVLALVINGGPDGNHQLNTHFLELIHRLWWMSSTVGQMETISSIPISLSSSTIACGSGQYSGSNRHSPCIVQWKKSITITEMGR